MTKILSKKMTENKPYIIATLFIISVVGQSSAVQPKHRYIVERSNPGWSAQVCYDVARMLENKNPSPNQMCQWRFRPKGPNAQSPDYHPVDIRQHMEWLRDISTQYDDQKANLTYIQRDALWIQKYRKRDLADVASNKYIYEEAFFDMTGDGKPEHVILRSQTDCDPKHKGRYASGPKLFLVRPDGRIQRNLVGGGGNPFSYEGKLYFLSDYGQFFEVELATNDLDYQLKFVRPSYIYSFNICTIRRK